MINNYDKILPMSTSDVDCHHINLLPTVGNLNVVVAVAVHRQWSLGLASRTQWSAGFLPNYHTFHKLPVRSCSTFPLSCYCLLLFLFLSFSFIPSRLNLCSLSIPTGQFTLIFTLGFGTFDLHFSILENFPRQWHEMTNSLLTCARLAGNTSGNLGCLRKLL